MSRFLVLFLLLPLSRGYLEPQWPSDSRLRNGKEAVIRLRPQTTATLYFPMQRSSSFWLLVTPCGATVKWKLAQREFQSEPAFDLSVSLNGSQSESKQLLLNANEALLVQEVGAGRMEYEGHDLPEGVLILNLLSESQQTSVTIFPTTEPERILEFYPKIPSRDRDRRVELENVTSSSAAIKWVDSPSINWMQERHIHYCLILSLSQSYETFCEAMGGAGVAVAAEEDGFKSNSLVEPNWLETKKARSPAEITATRPLVLWRKYKNTMEFAELRPGQKYYLSLFAVNKYTGGTGSYIGLSFRTPSEDTEPKKVVSLEDGKLLAAYLNPARATFQLYEYRVLRPRRRILVIVQPCSGDIRVVLFKNHQLYAKAAVSGLQRFVVRNAQPGLLRIKVVNEDNEEKMFKILASSHVKRDPYVSLPEDPSLKVMESTRGCSELTLAWLSVPSSANYCLYQRVEKDDYFKRLILEESSQCRGPPSGSHLATCQVHLKSKYRNKNADIMPIKELALKGLAANTMYRFDLLVSPMYRSHSQALSYRTIWVKTKSTCTNDSF